jgi:hypothetical protein
LETAAETPIRRLGIGRILVHASIIFCLTILTEIGGVIWLLALLLRARMGRTERKLFLLLFIGLYVFATLVTQQLAPFFGREPLPCFVGAEQNFVVRSPFYCVLNRNYVTPKLRKAAEALAQHMDDTFPGTKTLALDANFPFFDGVPLIPHLSHNDGRKLDIAFYYQDADGQFRNGETRSPIGYFAFEPPLANSPQPCASRRRWLNLRWDFAWLQPVFPDWHMEPGRMREALQWMAGTGKRYGIEKIFVEPHIPARLGVGGGVIRFQGCNAARHDDHIHIQVR